MTLPDTHNSDKTLYERLGGDAFFNLLVTSVFDEKLEHPGVKHFFENVPVSALKTHQVKFFRVMFGPPHERPSDDELCDFMIRTHTHLFRDRGLNEQHYDIAAECFAMGLQTMQVDQSMIDECMAILGPMRDVFEYGNKIAQQETKLTPREMITLPLASPATVGTDTAVVLPEYSHIEIPEWLPKALAKHSKTPQLRVWTCDLTNRFGPEGDERIADTFMDQPYMDHHVYLVAFLQLAFMPDNHETTTKKHQKKMLDIVQHPRGKNSPKLSQELYRRMIAQFLIASVKLGLAAETMKKAEAKLRSHVGVFAKKTTLVGGVTAPHFLKRCSATISSKETPPCSVSVSICKSLLQTMTDDDNTSTGVTSEEFTVTSSNSLSIASEGSKKKKKKRSSSKKKGSSKDKEEKEKPKQTSSGKGFGWLKGTTWGKSIGKMKTQETVPAA